MKDTLAKWLAMDSTWRGFILILTVLGVHLSPGNSQTIIEFGLGTVGAWLVARNR